VFGPRSDEFECQGQRSKVKVTRDKIRAVTPGSIRMVCARCKQRAAAADGTIASLSGGDLGGLHAVYVW